MVMAPMAAAFDDVIGKNRAGSTASGGGEWVDGPRQAVSMTEPRKARPWYGHIGGMGI